MASAVWPVSLPQTLLLGATPIARDTVLRTEPSVGPGQTRRISTAAVEDVEGRVVLNESQYATFTTFWRTTLAMGALDFDWKRPDTGAACVMRLRQPPRATPIGKSKYMVQLTLEILP